MINNQVLTVHSRNLLTDVVWLKVEPTLVHITLKGLTDPDVASHIDSVLTGAHALELMQTKEGGGLECGANK